MRLLWLLLLLAGCDGEVYYQCPSPLGLMQAVEVTGCFDAQPALNLITGAGMGIDASSVHMTVLNILSWPEGGKTVEGFTTETDVTLGTNHERLLHELIHVHERPFLTDHQAWADNGDWALDDFFGYVTLGQLNAWGFRANPCRPPTMPEPMQANLRAAGYPIDAWLAADVCQEP